MKSPYQINRVQPQEYFDNNVDYYFKEIGDEIDNMQREAQNMKNALENQKKRNEELQQEKDMLEYYNNMLQKICQDFEGNAQNEGKISELEALLSECFEKVRHLETPPHEEFESSDDIGKTIVDFFQDRIPGFGIIEREERATQRQRAEEDSQRRIEKMKQRLNRRLMIAIGSKEQAKRCDRKSNTIEWK